MRSYISLIVVTVLAVVAHGSADREPLVARGAMTCKPSANGDCAACGANWVACGTDACYNPVAGDICCSNRYACPSTSNCTTTGIGCVPRKGKARECPQELRHLISSSSSSSASSSTASSSSSTTSSSSNSLSTTDSTTSSSASTTDSSSSSTFATTDSTTSSPSSPTSPVVTSSDTTTSSTLTITSTTTSTVTVSMASPSGECHAPTVTPLTSSMAPFGNYSSTSMVALNTTTSTLSLTNVSSTIPGTISVPVNATKPTSTIVPPINGFKGAAGRSGASVFALGGLVFVAAFLV